MVGESRRLTAADFPVAENERAAILDEFLSQLDARQLRRDTPVLGVVAGQPASGKSRTIGQMQHAAGRPFAVLDSDELRLLHPQMDEIMQRDPFRMDVLSNGPVGEWMSGALAHCRSRGYDTVIENTRTNPDELRTTLEAFRDAGFTVHAEVLAVPEPVSRLGIVTRYLAGADLSRSPRWTTEASHQRAFAGMGAGLRELDGAFDSVRVRDRTGAALYVGVDTDQAATALDRRRANGLSPAQRAEWASDYGWACPRLTHPSMVTDQTRTVLRNLVADADELLSPDQRPREHEQLRSAVAPPNQAPRAQAVMPRTVGRGRVSDVEPPSIEGPARGRDLGVGD